MKSWLSSKTIWLGILMTTAGIFGYLHTQYPTLSLLVTIKGVLDIVLRFATTQPIE